MTAMLELRNITKQFGGLTAVNDLSMKVEEHEIHALIGPNGAGKTTATNMIEGVYQAPCMSFTKQTMNEITVAKKHLTEGENVLIIDDFLAHGEASKALAKIVEEAGAHVAGIGIVISKDFQGGKQALEDLGYRVETLASVTEMVDGNITFA